MLICGPRYCTAVFRLNVHARTSKCDGFVVTVLVNIAVDTLQCVSHTALDARLEIHNVGTRLQTRGATVGEFFNQTLSALYRKQDKHMLTRYVQDFFNIVVIYHVWVNCYVVRAGNVHQLSEILNHGRLIMADTGANVTRAWMGEDSHDARVGD